MYPPPTRTLTELIYFALDEPDLAPIAVTEDNQARVGPILDYVMRYQDARGIPQLEVYNRLVDILDREGIPWVLA